MTYDSNIQATKVKYEQKQE